jgi:1-aminocyclopropane-1-carboxylate deaminase/D-cysteine desulfhydrase-like pyridoxal-dependent ACC family enzyme
MEAIDFKDIPPSPLQRIYPGFIRPDGPGVYIKRDDLLPSALQGNKFRKLKYILLHALAQGYEEIVSFGGAYSNHVHALSHVPGLTGLGVTCYIRGEIDDPSNPTLQFARDNGIRLVALPRQTYSFRNDPAFQEHLMRNHPKGYLVPEGGTHELAVRGVAECALEISRQLGKEPSCCFVPVGSGGTMAGMLSGFGGTVHMVGVPAFAGSDAIKEVRERIRRLAGDPGRHVELNGQFHFGGFARMTEGLFQIIHSFHEETGILLDPVYTCKMVAAFSGLRPGGGLSGYSEIVLVHTGGLQGWGGFSQRYGHKFDLDKLPLGRRT